MQIAQVDLDTRRRLLDAAAAVFQEDGYDNARVADIARRAGLTTGAIYSHYRGKADLLQETVAECGSNELADMVDHWAGDTSGAELLRALGHGLTQRPDRSLLFEAFVAARRDPEVATVLLGDVDVQSAKMRFVVETAKAHGEIDPSVDTEAVITFAQTLAFGSMVAEAIGLPAPDPAGWDPLIDRLVTALENPRTPQPRQEPTS